MNTSTPQKFKFFLKHFRPNSYKSISLLKKLRPKLGSLTIPLKGSFNYHEYVLTDILKNGQLERSCLRTLQKVKTCYISHEFIQFFLKNKQVLKGIRSLKAQLNNLSLKRARFFAKMLNRMNNLNKFDDAVELCKQKPTSKSKSFRSIFSGKNIRRPRGNGELLSNPATSEVVLNNLPTLKKVQGMKCPPNLNFKKIFPVLKRLEKLKPALLENFLRSMDQGSK